LSELRDALEGHNRGSLEMHLEAVVEQVWRCIWRLRLSNSDMHLDTKIKKTQTARVNSEISTELSDTLGGHD
jgi:hypothetical protein